ncbi:hypothetical protein CEXT_219921 [Caerostris extrusa]|uniref:Ycf15 n=1 Tax=Caerostris extrusa TaxID=172846 RepID=A0AAV4NVS1_CAEEX|nr:hypothetical protein CEXT_219921 [Caerostris extrusa]
MIAHSSRTQLLMTEMKAIEDVWALKIFRPSSRKPKRHFSFQKESRKDEKGYTLSNNLECPGHNQITLA